jgi:small subunit ribosomal protein S1
MSFKKYINPNEETSTDTSDFERMLADSFGKADRRVSVGDRIRAEVLSVGKENVIVSTGTRFDGFVPAEQLLNEKGESKVKVGDTIDLFVTFSNGSQIFLSPNPTSKNLAEDIQDAFSKGLPVEGRVEGVNKGGFDVLILGKRAFCPMGQMDLKRIDKAEDYVGQKYTFKITQLTEGGRNVVVSRRSLLQEAQTLAQANFKDQHMPGEKFTGKVTRVEPFGCFIEIAPGLEGMAHVSELAWTRVSNPQDVVKVGDVVSGKILDIENQGNRLKISLTLKQADNDPWNNLPSSIALGRVVVGKVTRLAPFGAFVELAPGVDGLLPLSEMSATKRVVTADEVVKVGETVTVLVKNLDVATRRISLSIKGAVEQAARLAEEQDIREYHASEATRAKFSSAGQSDLASKLAAALAKQK